MAGRRRVRNPLEYLQSRKRRFICAMLALVIFAMLAMWRTNTRIGDYAPDSETSETTTGESSKINQWDVIIAGGGPAGTGPLISAVVDGRWEQLMALRVLLVERQSSLVVGQYSTFTHGESNSQSRAITHQARGSPAAAQFFHQASVLAEQMNESPNPPYRQVANYLASLGNSLEERMQRAGSAVWLQHSVTHVQLTSEGFRVTIGCLQTGHVVTQHARYLIIAMGGVEAPLPSFVPLRTMDASMLSLKQFLANPEPAFSKLRSTPRSLVSDIQRPLSGETPGSKPVAIVIIGGSHGAWQIVELLNRRASIEQRAINITMIRRSSIVAPPLYYECRQDALAAGYNFSTGEVDPVTGKINRFSGIRGPPRSLILNALYRQQPLAYTSITFAGASQSGLESLVRTADLVFHATGYRARLPELFDIDGSAMELATSLTRDNQLMHLRAPGRFPTLYRASDGRPVHHLFAYGLGAGLLVNDQYGGEPQLTGRARLDGVWLYQFDIGRKLVDELLTADTTPTSISAGWHRIYEAKAKKASDDTPFHVLGGFDQYTDQQWLLHVEKVIAPLSPIGPYTAQHPATLFENGVGCGAFVNAWQRLHPQTRLSGLDYSPASVQVASSRLNGTFAVGRVDAISAVATFAHSKFDYVVSYGVVLYLDSLEMVERMVMSMLAHTTHWVAIFEINDLAFKSQATAMRTRTHTPTKQNRTSRLPTPPQLFVPRDLFVSICKQKNVRLVMYSHTCLGLTYITASYRYSVYIDTTRAFDTASLEGTTVCQKGVSLHSNTPKPDTPNAKAPWTQAQGTTNTPKAKPKAKALWTQAQGTTNTPKAKPKAKANDKMRLSQAVVSTAMANISSLLRGCKVEHAMLYGSLLGLIRDGKPIDGDNDVDLLLPSEAREVLLACPAFGRSCTRAVKHNCFTRRAPWLWQLNVLVEETPVLIDFYIGLTVGNAMCMCHDKRAFPLRAVYPFRILEASNGSDCIGCSSFFGPNAPVEIIALTYGPDWRIPIRKESSHSFKVYAHAIMPSSIKELYAKNCSSECFPRVKDGS